MTAREIVAQHENTKPLQLQVEDATAKVELLKTEIAFNQALTETLEQVHNLSRRVDAGRNSLAEGDVIAAIESLEDTEKILADTAFPKNSNVTAILYEGLNGLRRSIIEALSVRWGSLVQIDKKKHQLVLPDQKGSCFFREYQMSFAKSKTRYVFGTYHYRTIPSEYARCY